MQGVPLTNRDRIILNWRDNISIDRLNTAAATADKLFLVCIGLMAGGFAFLEKLVPQKDPALAVKLLLLVALVASFAGFLPRVRKVGAGIQEVERAIASVGSWKILCIRIASFLIVTAFCIIGVAQIVE